MKRIPFILVTVFFFSIQANEIVPEATHDAPASELETNTHVAETAEKPKPKPMLFSFNDFIRAFLILLNNPQIQNSLKAIDIMLVKLLQTSIQIIQNGKLKFFDPENIGKKLLEHDPALRRALIETMQKSIGETIATREYSEFHSPNCNCHKPKDAPDKTTQVVLGNFARIASHFINILHDPHNSENVTNNIAGMLTGVATIGAEVIKSGKIDENSDEQIIRNYVEHLDKEVKHSLHAQLHERFQYD